MCVLGTWDKTVGPAELHPAGGAVEFTLGTMSLASAPLCSTESAGMVAGRVAALPQLWPHRRPRQPGGTRAARVSNKSRFS